MDWIGLLIVIVVVLLLPVLIGFGAIRIGRRYFPVRPLLGKATLVYPIVLVVWVAFLWVIAEFLFLGSAGPMMGPPPISSSAPAPDAKPPIASAPVSPGVAFPQFPWPPPVASSFVTISMQRVLASVAKERKAPYLLADVDFALITALTEAGHFERSYYSIPQGYALVTRLESIESDGFPKPGQARWNVEAGSADIFSLSSYLRALFSAPPGRYRVIVFLITPEPFAAADATVSREEVTQWLSLGGNRLPAYILAQPVDSRTACTTMIYEFQKDSSSAPARMLRPGRISANVHIVGTGLARLIQ